MFNASVCISVGSGDQTMFWEDPWISGQTVASLAPAVLALVRPGLRRRRTVGEGLVNDAWARDVAGELSIDAVVQ